MEKYNLSINKLLSTALKCASSSFAAHLDEELFSIDFREGLSLGVSCDYFITGNKENLSLTLSPEMIKRLLSSQADTQVSININETTVVFKEGRSKTSFPLVSEEYNKKALPTQAISNELHISAKYLLYALKRTIFALPKKNTSEPLNNFMFSANGNKVRIATSDSFKYASQLIDCSTTCKEDFSIHSFVMIKLMPLIQNAIEENEDEEIVFSFYSGIDKMKISSSLFTAICNYTNSVKLNGETLLSTKMDYHQINHREFLETMKRIIPFVSTSNTKLNLDFGETDIVKISYKSASVEIDELVSMTSDKSAYREVISLNASFLNEFAELESEHIKLGIKNNRSPVYIYADNGFEGLLCPTITR